MANPLAITLHALGIESSSGQSAAVDIEAIRSAARLTLTITAVVGGAPTITLETSPDGTTGWRHVGGFTALGAAASEERSFDQCDRYLRVAWTVGTSATFSVAGDAHQLFVQRADVEAEIGESALSEVEGNDYANALIKASCDIEDALAGAYVPPFSAIPLSVRQRGGAIAAFRALKQRGFDPDNPADALVLKGNDDAMSWLARVARGALKPPGIIDSTPATYEAAAAVVSNTARGW